MITVDDPLVKLTDGAFIRSSGIAQFHQQRMRCSLRHLLCGEYDINAGFARNPAQDFPEKCVKLFEFVFAHRSDGTAENGDDLSLRAYIAAADNADIALIFVQTPFDLSEFFPVHIPFLPVIRYCRAAA